MNRASILPADALRQVLESGLQAPSAENRHHLVFERRPDGVQLVSTDASTWQERPHRRLLALVSYGAVIENMALRAGQLGHAQTTCVLPDRTRPDLIADIGWRAGSVAAEELASAIAERHSNRLFFERGPLPAATLDRLAGAADVVPGVRVHWLDEPAQRALALRALRLAEGERFRRKALHAELFGEIRFDIGWRRSTSEGLPPGALGIEPGMRLGFRALRHWPLMRVLAALGLHRALGWRAGDMPCRWAPHLALISADASDQGVEWLQAGRALQRLWLASTLERLAMQVMASPVALALQRPGNGWVCAGVQDELHRLLAALCEEAPGAPCMFLRLGRAEKAPVVTKRPPLEQFLH